MNVYADTSWWLACKLRDDAHHLSAVSLFDQTPSVRMLWTAWHRVEVFNALRQAEYTKLIASGEAAAVIRSLEQEVRIGYWPLIEFDWSDAVRTASELSAAHSLSRRVRSMDLFHVAVAAEVAADVFLSFDRDQNALAAAAGFSLLRLSRLKRR